MIRCSLSAAGRLVDGLKEFTKLDCPNPLMQLADNGGNFEVERYEQVDRAVAQIVRHEPLGLAGTHRPHWLAAVERLDLRLSIHAQDQHAVGRVEVKPHVYDNVRVPKENLLGELNAGLPDVDRDAHVRARFPAARGTQRSARLASCSSLAKNVDFEGGPPWKNPYVRQKIAQFATKARCLLLSRYLSLSARLKRKVLGAESSFGKLFSTKLKVRVAMFADEMIGAFANVEGGSLGAVEGSRWMHRTLVAAKAFTVQHNITGGSSSCSKVARS